MPWNWQHKNWPNFSFSASALRHLEHEFLYNAGLFAGNMEHLDEKTLLNIELLSEEGLKNSQIEGQPLNRDSLRTSIRKQFGLYNENADINPEEYGMSELLVDLYNNFAQDLNHHKLHLWHSMLMSGRRDISDIGRYRTHEDPMQIVSGPLGKQTVHFEAPPSKQVFDEMEAFVHWINSTRGGVLNPLARAGLAHLYFESIHPFEDGNGRIGRALSEMALSQSIGRPTLIAISHVIENDKKSYYEALHKNSLSLDLTDWLLYFGRVVIKAQAHSQSLVDFLIAKGKFYDRFDALLNERQRQAVERIFREGLEGFQGGMSAKNYKTIAGASDSTATRDLQKMVEIGAMKKTGELKATRYQLNIGHPAFEW